MCLGVSHFPDMIGHFPYSVLVSSQPLAESYSKSLCPLSVLLFIVSLAFLSPLRFYLAYKYIMVAKVVSSMAPSQESFFFDPTVLGNTLQSEFEIKTLR